VKTNYRVIASRTRHEGRIVDQTLCLTNGSLKRYRIHTSEDGGQTESPDDIEPVEFDIATDIGLSTFLIESFWRLEISVAVIDGILREVSDESA
jgi:hypothetical protein